MNSAEKEIHLIKEQCEELRSDKKKMEDQIERIQNQLDKALEIGAPITKLLEDQREGQGAAKKETEDKLNRLEADNAELRKFIEGVKEKEEQRRLARIEQRKLEKQRLFEEAERKNKSFFGRLFGS